ncbi:MAG: hypothetical protein OEY64_03170 [Nitrospinota bacterium]|nr:hypothetical protein [Nitrospinota bacterium]
MVIEDMKYIECPACDGKGSTGHMFACGQSSEWENVDLGCNLVWHFCPMCKGRKKLPSGRDGWKIAGANMREIRESIKYFVGSENGRWCLSGDGGDGYERRNLTVGETAEYHDIPAKELHKMELGGMDLSKIAKLYMPMYLWAVDKCSVEGCELPGDRLCDYPVSDDKSCDFIVCEDHSIEIGVDIHLCHVHVEFYKKANDASGMQTTSKLLGHEISRKRGE